MYNYLCEIAWALIDREFDQRSQFAIQADNGLAAGNGPADQPWMMSEAAGRLVSARGRAFAFGPFLLLPSQRLLLEGDSRVPIGSRAFDILTMLVERAGEVVGKDELIARVWPKVFVDDGNLKVQVSMLRRALGEGRPGRRYIVAIPGRGYNFVAPVSLAQDPPPERPEPISYRHHHQYDEVRKDKGGSVRSLPRPMRAPGASHLAEPLETR